MEARVHCSQWSRSHILIHSTVYSVNIQVQRFSFQAQQRDVCAPVWAPTGALALQVHQAVETHASNLQPASHQRDNSWPCSLAVCPVLVCEAQVAQISDVIAWHILLCTNTYNRISIYDLFMHLERPCGHHGLEIKPHSHSNGCSGSLICFLNITPL